MSRAGDRARLEAKALDPVPRRVQQLAREELDGDRPVEPSIARSIDFTHAAGTEWCQDLERTEAGAGREPHRMSLTAV
jgi:hypothetical protein